MLVVGAIGACALALFAARPDQRDVRRTWVRVDRIADAVVGLNFAMPASVLSAPLRPTPVSVATIPTGSVSVAPSTVAAVSIGLMHQLVITRIGGRYGP